VSAAGGDLRECSSHVMPQILPSLLRFAAAAAVVSDQTAGLRPGGLSAGATAAGRLSVVCSFVSAVDSPPGLLPDIPGVFWTAARLVEHSAGQVSDSP
jgi:hypothetical protein